MSADPGNIIEVRVVVRNEGAMTANHVQVIGHVPEVLGTEHIFSATIQAPYGGGTSITDTARVTITDGSDQTFRYEPGHARIFGVTNLFNCPSGCPLDDLIASTGLEIGNVGPGESVQVAFKARMTNLIAVTPTPTPTIVPTITPTPTGVPTITPTPTVTQPPQVGGQQQEQSQTAVAIAQNQTSVENRVENKNESGPITINFPEGLLAGIGATPTPVPQPTITPAPTPLPKGKVAELPKTGLPLLAWAFGGFLPAGALLKRIGLRGRKNKNQETPYSLWQEREFFKD